MCCAKACYLCLPCQKSKCSMLSSLQFMCYAKACCLHSSPSTIGMFNAFQPSTSHHGFNFFGVFNFHHPCEMFTCYSSFSIIVSWVLFMCCSCLSLKPNVVCVCHWSGVLHVVPISNPLK
jgi:hypothetical protein